MHLHTTSLCLFLLALTGSLSLAQHRPAPVSVPTYNQIKPANREIYDHIDTGANQSARGSIRSFDYPDSKATYTINSKIVSNVVARQRVAQPGMYIDSPSVSQPNDAGKRLIRIRRLPKRP